MRNSEFFSRYRTYSYASTVSRMDFIEAITSIEDMDDSTFRLEYRLVCIDPQPLLDMVHIAFGLELNNEISYKILLEILLSTYIFNTYIDEGDIKTFRNMVLDIFPYINTENQFNKTYKESIIDITEALKNGVIDIDMDSIDSIYNYLDDTTGVLKQFKISNNNYLVAFLGWDRNDKTISFIIS